MWWPSTSDTVPLSSTLGVFLLATIIAAVLYGVTVLQVMQYVDRFFNDPLATKFLVFVLCLFESATIVLEVHGLYYYTISHHGTQFAAASVPQSLAAERAFSYATIFAVQIFFAARIQQVGKGNWFLPIATGVLATATIVIGLIATVVASKYGVNDSSQPAFVNVLSTTSAGLQIGTDVLIATSLYWLCRNRAGDMKKRVLVKHAIISAVNRGVFSALFQILTTATYFALRPRLVWIAFHMASSKVHALSLLSTLNTRTVLDGEGYDSEVADARLRRRLARELRRSTGVHNELASRPESPPIIPSIAHGLHSSQISWFESKSHEGGLGSYAPSYHARSTTAVDGGSASG